MAVYSVELAAINRALVSLMDRVDHGECAVDLANAIDHLGIARELLGGEAEDEPPEDNPRQRGDDDGVEYADPSDELARRLLRGQV